MVKEAVVPPAPRITERDHGAEISAGWGKGPTQELFQKILCEVASGKTLRSVARSLGTDEASLRYHITHDAALFAQYQRARACQSEAMADEILAIADDASQDTETRYNERGEEYKTEDKEWTNRSKLRVDSRKWLMSKLHPRQYGEKLEIGGNAANAGDLNITVNLFDGSPAQMKLARPVQPDALMGGTRNGNGNGNAHD